MKINLRSTLLFVSLVGGMIMFSHPSLFASPLKVSLAPPTEALDFSDLDARDKNNNQIHVASELNQMKNLFSKNLADLLLFNLTPRIKKWIDVTNKIWEPISGFLHSMQIYLLVFCDEWIEGKRFKKLITSLYQKIFDSHQSGQFNLPSMKQQTSTYISSIISSTQILR